ncbi:LuxR C-terminal-related transcriptional regulator [Actinoplanes missouriensis]|uniref:LuxR C-terminal-related transcriptional regulator n=1 Tax=Actinoplanes missouriensis TaxID=1866 RepID=UPI0033F18096
MPPRILVPRERLHAELDAAVRGAITLVRAGAGWGKTVLVASWARARAEPVVWLTLRDGHNDPGVFRTDLLAALAASPAAPGADLVLVLDDHHRVTSADAFAELDRLLHTPSRRVRVVLAGRGEPALPTHAWQAAGELTVIDAGALAFTGAEAAALAEAAELPTPPDGLPALLERTEGWAAGLRLGDAPGSAAVGDFLDSAVLRGLPSAARRLLLLVSVLETVPVDLAAELAAEPHAGQILDSLARADAFVTADPREPARFRLHPQLRATLLHRLRQDDPDLPPRLHRTAMRWYAANDQPYEALDHAAAAEDWTALGRLVVGTAAPMIVSPDRARLFAVLRRIPWPVFERDAELAFCGALRLFGDGDFTAAPEQLARVERLLAGRDEQDRLMTESAAGLLEVTVVSRVRGEMPKVVEQTTRVLRRLAGVRLEQMPAAHQYRAVAIANKGIGLFWTGRADAAERYLWAGLSAARTGGVQLVEMNMLGHLGALALVSGSRDDARDYATECRRLAEQHGLETTPQATLGYLVEAFVAVERNDVAGAEQAVRRALHWAPYPHEAALVTMTGVVRAHLLLLRGLPEAARDVIRQTRRDWPDLLDAPLLERWLNLTESETDLSLDDPEAILTRYGFVPEHTLLAAEQASLGRAFLVTGDLERAGELFARATIGRDPLSAIIAWIGVAVVAERQGRDDEALAAIRRADELAARDRISWPFHRFPGEQAMALLQRSRLTAETGRPEPDAALPPLAEDLSQRELEVLRFLPTLLTANEIADDLMISVNTVKAHMRAIYRKLGAARRREAVLIARERGMLLG